MKIIIDVPNHIANLFTMDKLDSRALLLLMMAEGLCPTARDVITHIRNMGIEDGTEHWKAWVQSRYDLADQEISIQAQKEIVEDKT